MERITKMAKDSSYRSEHTEGTLALRVWRTAADVFQVVKRNSRSLLCAVLVLFFRLAVGLNLMNFYTEAIFFVIVKDREKALAWCSVFLAFGVVISFLTPYIMNNFGRKVVYISACTMYAFGYMSVAAGLLKPQNITVSIVGLFLSYAAFSLGCGPVPYVLGPELLSNEARAIGVGLGHASYWLVSFVVGSTLPDLERAFGGVEELDDETKHTGLAYVFVMYGCIAVFASLFVSTFVPETQDMSYDQIQRFFYPDRCARPPEDISRKASSIGRGTQSLNIRPLEERVSMEDLKFDPVIQSAGKKLSKDVVLVT
jgi:MFS family permease